jgi:hypothetical protein
MYLCEKIKRMDILSSDVLNCFKSALNKLTGYKRRDYAAELCELFFDNSARKMERSLKVGRAMIKLGQHERRSGIRCVDAYNLRGAKKKSSRKSVGSFRKLLEALNS